jgi:2-amino-4-hydroxy-6-hydroxymethyldihydropteridine diphosphokinase
MKIIFLGVGSSLNNREHNLKEAVVKINDYIGLVVLSSSVYETEPWGFQSEDEFLNMVVKVETKLAPYELLDKISMIESQLGRIRTEKQYTSRVIDIDILFYDDLTINDANLKIPHPLLHDRRFVLVPLCEIDPEFVHPVLNKPILSLLNSCSDTSIVKIFNKES